jgi:2-polyprenyl-3-methyl-5-hydroxy-6-metoxy-1,4-benzoquinol methylase
MKSYRFIRFLKKIARGENPLVIQQSAEIWDRQFSQGKWDFMLHPDKRYAIQTIARLIEKHARSNLSILDVGCGNGALAEELKEKSHISYTGIDISHVALQRAKQLHPKGVFICADITDPPRNQLFDIVVFAEILYYVNIASILPQYKALLKPNGTVMVSMYVSWRNWILWVLLRQYAHIKSIQKINAPEGTNAWYVATCHFKD